MEKTALFSLFDRRKSVGYAKQLIGLGWKIVATKETFELFRKNNVPVKDISDFLGIRRQYPFPPTLHPGLESALVSRVGKAIDFVYIRTYPPSKGNDVGGHTILALAAKGQRIAVSSAADMERTIEDLTNNNEISPSLRRELIYKTHIKIIRHYLSFLRDAGNGGDARIIIGEKVMSLREGENPYQSPAYLFITENEDRLGLSRFKQVSGVEPCYTNMADLDCILHTMSLLAAVFDRHYKKIPYLAIASKHGNPAGLSVDWNDPAKAVKNALFGNPLAIFGGEIITNFPVTKKLAGMLEADNKRARLLGSAGWTLDLIAAPDFEREAVEILGRRRQLKLFKNKNLARPHLTGSKWLCRMVRGGFLQQPPYTYLLDLAAGGAPNSRGSGPPAPKSNILDSMIISWAAAWTSNHGGNEVAVAKNRMLIAAGGGPSTVDACRTAIERAKRCGHDLRGSVFAANAFFPFEDAPRLLVEAGCGYGIVPKGGRNFKLIKKYFKRKRIKVFYLCEQYRGFSRH